MLKKDKWADWYDSLDDRTKDYIKKQPIYTARDYDTAIIFSLVIGIIIGLIF